MRHLHERLITLIRSRAESKVIPAPRRTDEPFAAIGSQNEEVPMLGQHRRAVRRCV